VYLEGFVTAGSTPECLVVRDHDGNTYVLEGVGWRGIIGNDYVRLQGQIVPTSRCGLTSAIQVADVTTVWSDEAHKVIVYDRTHEGRFVAGARRHREREWGEWEREHNIPPPPPPHP